VKRRKYSNAADKDADQRKKRIFTISVFCMVKITEMPIKIMLRVLPKVMAEGVRFELTLRLDSQGFMAIH
jgi:hypothetical protein